MKLLTNAQFLEYCCEHCGFNWCAVDETADAESCQNCGTPDVAPSRAHSLHHSAIADEARP